MKERNKGILVGALIGLALGAGVVARAVDIIPITFKDGDVISAEVWNTLFKRINDTRRLPTAANLEGQWSCKEARISMIANAGYTPDTITPDPFTATRVNTLTFGAATNGVMSLTATWAPFDFLSVPGSFNGTAVLAQGTRVLAFGTPAAPGFGANISYMTKDALEINSATSAASLACVRTNAVPEPVDALGGSQVGANIVLNWIDQSENEQGFRIEGKLGAGNWGVRGTTTANVQTFTITAPPTGTYTFRVVSVNAQGSSISSSEIQVVVQ